jgi:hypothetical protein
MNIAAWQITYSMPLSNLGSRSLAPLPATFPQPFPVADSLSMATAEAPPNLAADMLQNLLQSFAEVLQPCQCSEQTAPVSENSSVGDSKSDPELAGKIDAYLEKHNSPGAGSGKLFVEAGQKHGVDPLLLLAIAGHETGYGTLGIGANGMLGVGAYDHNPENALTDPQFAGLANQLEVGGRTFDHWRTHFGGSESDSIEEQVKMVGQKWATDPQWHLGVMRHYEQIQQSIG